MSIIVKNVTKVYGEQAALNNVSFSIQKGEIVGFIGPNGAGKSTMMKIINAIIPQTSGEVLVNNLDLNNSPVTAKQLIGYLPENNPLYLNMYVKEYLNFVAGFYDLKTDSNRRISEIIEMTGLQAEQHKHIGALSKGYKQRVGLAQALLHDPEVLILDEPTTGLDPNQIIEIRELIKNIGRNKTVMLSTHIMQEVEAICHRIIVIKNGAIIADGSTAEVKDNKGKLTIVVEFNAAVESKSLESINEVASIAKIDDYNWLIEAKEGMDPREALFSFAVKNSISVLSMQKREARLEDVFRELTRN